MYCTRRGIRSLAKLSAHQRLQLSVAPQLSQDDDQDAKPFAEIPGPKGLPYFGQYFQYKLGKLDILKRMDIMCRWHQEYGSVFKETLLGNTVVHVSDPEDIRTIYANEDKTPAIQPLTEATRIFRERAGMSPGLGNSNGEEWYRIRSNSRQLMMRLKELVPFLPGVDGVARDFITHLKHHRDISNEVPDFAKELGIWMLESSGLNCFSRRLGYLTEEGRREAEEMLVANEMNFALNTELSVSLPLYKYIITPKWKKLFNSENVLMKSLEKHLNRALVEMREKTENKTLEGEGNDHLFLRYMMSRKDLTFQDVTTLTLSLFTDSLSGTKNQMLFLLYLLATNPRVQEKAYQEIRAATPDYPAPVTSDSVSQMTYIRACIKESVRMLPVINESSRVTKNDMVLGGYHIPAETPLCLDNFALFRDASLVDDPDTFIPERWLREWTGQKVHSFLVLPFGHGPRMCAGRRFAEQDMAVLLTHLLHNFRLEWNHCPLGLIYSTLNVPDSPVQITFHDRH